MRFELDIEQRDLFAIAQQFFTEAIEADLGALLAGDREVDPKIWSRLATEVGFAAIAVPGDCEGADGTWLDLAVVLEAAGHAVSSTPLFVSAGAAVAVLRAAGGPASSTLARIAAGEIVVTWVDARQPGVAFEARNDGDRWSLTGSFEHVPNGDVADLLLVTARTPGGRGLFVVEPTPDAIVPEASLDPSRTLVTVSLADVEAVAVSASLSDEALARAQSIARILLASELVGVAQGALDMAVEHALLRHQFGRPIGGFQSIKHLLADAHAEVDVARTATRYAAWALSVEGADSGDVTDPIDLSALTMVTVAPAAERVTAAALQVLGGVGYTWEHPAHVYYKRALSSARLLGTVDEQLDQLSTSESSYTQ